MAEIYSFDPLAASDAKVLILGSMPGKASLARNQYYAHPRNAFWPIMAQLLGFDIALAYEAKIDRLIKAHIAVWDVLAACERNSSLDADIVESSLSPNDFAGFLDSHYEVGKIFFNGATAERLFRRYVQPCLGLASGNICLQRLPSTSPAHASMTFDEKLSQWRAVFEI